MANEVSKIYNDIAELLNVARAKAYHTVNTIMVETYWKIGQRIIEEEKLIKNFINKVYNRVVSLVKEAQVD